MFLNLKLNAFGGKRLKKLFSSLVDSSNKPGFKYSKPPVNLNLVKVHLYAEKLYSPTVQF